MLQPVHILFKVVLNYPAMIPKLFPVSCLAAKV
jgi:hypothetical protein